MVSVQVEAAGQRAQAAHLAQPSLFHTPLEGTGEAPSNAHPSSPASENSSLCDSFSHHPILLKRWLTGLAAGEERTRLRNVIADTEAQVRTARSPRMIRMIGS